MLSYFDPQEDITILDLSQVVYTCLSGAFTFHFVVDQLIAWVHLMIDYDCIFLSNSTFGSSLVYNSFHFFVLYQYRRDDGEVRAYIDYMYIYIGWSILNVYTYQGSHYNIREYVNIISDIMSILWLSCTYIEQTK